MRLRELFSQTTHKQSSKQIYCRGTRRGDVFDQYCTPEVLACFNNSLLADQIRYQDDYVARTIGVDYRIVDYCRNIECPADILASLFALKT